VSCHPSLVDTLAYVAIRIIAIPVPKTNVPRHSPDWAELHAKRAGEKAPFLVQTATGFSGADGHEGKITCWLPSNGPGSLVGGVGPNLRYTRTFAVSLDSC
jgi:hypothetical protein